MIETADCGHSAPSERLQICDWCGSIFCEDCIQGVEVWQSVLQAGSADVCRACAGRARKEAREREIRSAVAGADGRVSFESIMGFMRRTARNPGRC